MAPLPGLGGRRHRGSDFSFFRSVLGAAASLMALAVLRQGSSFFGADGRVSQLARFRT